MILNVKNALILLIQLAKYAIQDLFFQVQRVKDHVHHLSIITLHFRYVKVFLHNFLTFKIILINRQNNNWFLLSFFILSFFFFLLENFY